MKMETVWFAKRWCLPTSPHTVTTPNIDTSYTNLQLQLESRQVFKTVGFSVFFLSHENFKFRQPISNIIQI